VTESSGKLPRKDGSTVTRLFALLLTAGVLCFALGCTSTEDTSKKSDSKKEEKKDDKKDTKKDTKKDDKTGDKTSDKTGDKTSDKTSDKKEEKKPSASLKTDSMEIEKGKAAKTSISLAKKDFDDDVTLKFEAKDGDLKVPADAKIEKGKDKVEIEVTAGDKTGDFEITVTATGKDVKIDPAKLKVKVK
jgi:hypothetical protein